MAKVIQYKFLTGEVNRGTEEDPVMEKILLDKSITCRTQADYEANLPVAESEAVPGSLEVSGEFEGVVETPTDTERIEELEEALSMLLSGVTE